MRLLGIDFGSKRIGIAVSDPGNAVAFPKAVVANGPGAIDEIARLCAENDVGTVVIGESKNYQGEYNEIMKAALEFKSELEERLKLPLMLEPEFMTSAQAGRNTEEGMLDASAAALILQSHLDKLNNKGAPPERV